jgi:hypothetical protein
MASEPASRNDEHAWGLARARALTACWGSSDGRDGRQRAQHPRGESFAFARSARDTHCDALHHRSGAIQEQIVCDNVTDHSPNPMPR